MENYQESGSVKDLKNQLSHRQGYYPLYQPPTYLGTISVQTFDVALTGIAVVAFLTYALRLLVTAIRGTGRKKRSASNGNIPEHFPPLSDFMETLPKFAPEFGITGLELLVDFWTHEGKFQICSQYTRLGNSTGSENYQRALFLTTPEYNPTAAVGNQQQQQIGAGVSSSGQGLYQQQGQGQTNFPGAPGVWLLPSGAVASKNQYGNSLLEPLQQQENSLRTSSLSWPSSSSFGSISPAAVAPRPLDSGLNQLFSFDNILVSISFLSFSAFLIVYIIRLINPAAGRKNRMALDDAEPLPEPSFLEVLLDPQTNIQILVEAVGQILDKLYFTVNLQMEKRGNPEYIAALIAASGFAENMFWLVAEHRLKTVYSLNADIAPHLVSYLRIIERGEKLDQHYA
ncbi:unnamed protein product, partial [Notodromas monacha]